MVFQQFNVVPLAAARHAEGGSQHGELHTDDGVEVLLVATASDYLPDLT